MWNWAFIKKKFHLVGALNFVGNKFQICSLFRANWLKVGWNAYKQLFCKYKYIMHIFLMINKTLETVCEGHLSAQKCFFRFNLAAYGDVRLLIINVRR